jgi:hypothetical protein
MLLLGFHKFYWIGAQVPPVNSWPNFEWIDSTPGPNVTGAYSHWGYYMPQNIIEPNNIFKQELCAGANQTQAWAGAWGWADTKCDVAYPLLCRKNRGWRAWQSACWLPGCGVVSLVPLKHFACCPMQLSLTKHGMPAQHTLPRLLTP